MFKYPRKCRYCKLVYSKKKRSLHYHGGNERRVCKECKERYYPSEYSSHLHGRNSPVYGRKPEVILCGKNHPMYGKRGKDSPLFGRKHTKETRKKFSDANVQKWKDGKYGGKRYRKKISVANRLAWKRGSYDNVHFGRGKTGFRKDIGHFVRSTWEANYARILNYKGIRYEYEPHRFDTPYGSYCPDFWLVDKGVFVEIKGSEYNNIQRKKRCHIRRKYGERIIVLRRKRYRKLVKKFQDKIELEV